MKGYLIGYFEECAKECDGHMKYLLIIGHCIFNKDLFSCSADVLKIDYLIGGIWKDIWLDTLKNMLKSMMIGYRVWW